MICLTRRPPYRMPASILGDYDQLGSSIIITTPGGDTVTIRVISIEGRQVKIGIDAPLTFAVYRDDITEEQRAEYEAVRLKKLNQSAAVEQIPEEGNGYENQAK